MNSEYFKSNFCKYLTLKPVLGMFSSFLTVRREFSNEVFKKYSINIITLKFELYLKNTYQTIEIHLV